MPERLFVRFLKEIFSSMGNISRGGGKIPGIMGLGKAGLPETAEIATVNRSCLRHINHAAIFDRNVWKGGEHD